MPRRDKLAEEDKITKNFEKKRRGAPSFPYTTEIAKEICQTIAKTPKSINQLCAAYPHFPKQTTIFEWIAENEEFSKLYLEAKQKQVLAYMEETYDIADDSSRDVIIDHAGNVKPNSEFINRSKIRIELRKWHASRLMPKLFGDRFVADITDSKGISPEVVDCVKTLRDSIDLLKQHERDY